jgi:hypothetical protein
MHSALRKVGVLALLLCAVALAWPPPAAAAEAAMTVNLDGGKWKAVRLRNLPKDTVMAVAVQASGRIGVSLLSERDYRAFPKPDEPVFSGSVDKTLSFTISIPDTGHYYLVLDNRRSTEACKVKLAIRAKRGATTPAPRSSPPGEEPVAPEKLRGT